MNAVFDIVSMASDVYNTQLIVLSVQLHTALLCICVTTFTVAVATQTIAYLLSDTSLVNYQQ